MSHFKRKQSQVFWKYMESQDLGIPATNTVIDVDEVDLMRRSEHWESVGDHCSIPRPTFTPLLSPSEEEEGEEEEIGKEGKQDGPKDHRSMSFEKLGTTEANSGGSEDLMMWPDQARERSSSPRSFVGHRSQDSGFSDSERSEESTVDAYASRVERLRLARTRKSRRRRQTEDPQLDSKEQLLPVEINHDRYSLARRLDSPWAQSDCLSHPRHSSTPKASETRGRKLSASLPRGSKRRGRNSPLENWGAAAAEVNRKVADDDDEARQIEDCRVPRMIEVSMEDGECLGDFLYASEPPEDLFLADAGLITSGGAIRRSTHHPRNRTGNNSDNIRDQLAPVRTWLSHLALETEAECSATLQSKALPRIRKNYYASTTDNGKSKDFQEIQANDSTLLTASATAAATKLLARVELFQQCYQSAIEKLNQPGIGRIERSLVQSVEEEAFLLLSELGAPPPQRVRNLSSFKNILRQLRDLHNEVDRAVDARLDFYIERVVRGLEEAPREEGTAARGALAAMTVLGLGPGGSRGGRSIARCSGVRALLTTLLSIRGQSGAARESRAACLRALASVCCCAESIEQLVKNGGPEILADLLNAESAPEVEKMEAAALIVQITAPWTNAFGLPHLEFFADEFVRSLTILAEDTTCSQTLLLTAAALNNLASSPGCVEPMVDCKTVAALLRSVKRSGGGSIWLMEQVASLIGKLARSSELHPHLAEARASVALVCFLRMRPPGLESAYKRLEATASAALARLCVHREVAQQVVDVGGINCVIPYQSSSTGESSKTGNSRYTRSLRIACKKAAQQIDAAKASDRACTLDR